MFDGDGGRLGELREVRASCPTCIPAYRNELREALGQEFERFCFESLDGHE